MRTDAKNMVTTAGTIHLPEEKETIHMIFMLRRKLGQEVFMILVTFSTQNCLADCLTKSPAKAALKIFSHQIHENDHSMRCLRELPWILRVKMLRKQRLHSQIHASIHSCR